MILCVRRRSRLRSQRCVACLQIRLRFAVPDVGLLLGAFCRLPSACNRVIRSLCCSIRRHVCSVALGVLNVVGLLALVFIPRVQTAGPSLRVDSAAAVVWPEDPEFIQGNIGCLFRPPPVPSLASTVPAAFAMWIRRRRFAGLILSAAFCRTRLLCGPV